MNTENETTSDWFFSTREKLDTRESDLKAYIWDSSSFFKKENYEVHGWGNGYVLLPKQHPFYGLAYHDLNNLMRVYKGFTFAKEIYLDGKRYWGVGFDTVHGGDNLENCSKGFVINETLKLHKMLKQIKP